MSGVVLQDVRDAFGDVKEHLLSETDTLGVAWRNQVQGVHGTISLSDGSQLAAVSCFGKFRAAVLDPESDKLVGVEFRGAEGFFTAKPNTVFDAAKAACAGGYTEGGPVGVD